MYRRVWHLDKQGTVENAPLLYVIREDLQNTGCAVNEHRILLKSQTNTHVTDTVHSMYSTTVVLNIKMTVNHRVESVDYTLHPIKNFRLEKSTIYCARVCVEHMG